MSYSVTTAAQVSVTCL